MLPEYPPPLREEVVNSKHLCFIQDQAFEAVKLFRQDRSTALEKTKDMLRRDYDQWMTVFKARGYPEAVAKFWSLCYKASEPGAQS